MDNYFEKKYEETIKRVESSEDLSFEQKEKALAFAKRLLENAKPMDAAIDEAFANGLCYTISEDFYGVILENLEDLFLKKKAIVLSSKDSLEELVFPVDKYAENDWHVYDETYYSYDDTDGKGWQIKDKYSSIQIIDTSSKEMINEGLFAGKAQICGKTKGGLDVVRLLNGDILAHGDTIGDMFVVPKEGERDLDSFLSNDTTYTMYDYVKHGIIEKLGYDVEITEDEEGRQDVIIHAPKEKSAINLKSVVDSTNKNINQGRE